MLFKMSKCKGNLLGKKFQQRNDRIAHFPVSENEFAFRNLRSDNFNLSSSSVDLTLLLLYSLWATSLSL